MRGRAKAFAYTTRFSDKDWTSIKTGLWIQEMNFNVSSKTCMRKDAIYLTFKCNQAFWVFCSVSVLFSLSLKLHTSMCWETERLRGGALIPHLLPHPTIPLSQGAQASAYHIC